MSTRQMISIAALSVVMLPFALIAQTDVLPRPFEVYGGTIGTIDAIQVPGDTNKTRVFATTASANSVFWAEVDHANPTPFGTNFIMRVLPDLDANANFGTPSSLAAHQLSGRVFVGVSSGLLSCTTSAGSLTTDIPDAMSFVLIQGSYLFAVNDPGLPETPKTLYYGTLDASGSLTLGSALGTNFTGSSVSLAISPVNNKVYVLCAQSASLVLLKSSDDYNAFSPATTFSTVPSAAVTVSPAGEVAVGPDGRLFLGGGSSTLKVAYSDNEGAAWTNIDTGGNFAGSGSGLNIVCNGSSNAYEVYYGTVVSTNKGANGSWIGLPRPGGFRPPSMHVNAGCTKIDPNNSHFIYVTTDKGIGGSTNAVTDVVELNNGLLAFQINDIDAVSNKTVAWIASKAGIRIATNFNTTPVWRDGDFPDAIVFACAIDADDPNGLTGYAGSSRLYKTTTAGGTNASAWTSVFRWEDHGLTDGEMAAVKAQGNQVVLGYYSYALNSPSGGVFYSFDGGSNWEAVITNIDVQDILMRDEGGTNIGFVAVSKGKTGDRGGVYRMDASTIALDMTNEVNIRKLAEDSAGGIYASGTLPDASNPSRHCVVAYYRASNDSGWELLPTNGLPTGLWEGNVLGRVGGPPVITVGKDSASNDVPVLAALRTIYCLPYGGSEWITITNYPNGTQIKTLFWDELMVGTTIGLYGQGINAEPVITSAALGADFDGDRLADPAVYNAANGHWKIRLSNGSYALLTLTGFLGGSGWTAVAGDFDGDRKADPAAYQAASGTWLIKLSGANYALLTLTGFLGGPGYSGYAALTGDFDGDAKADPALYGAATGTWVVKLSTANYAAITRAGLLGSTGFDGIAGDLDRDGKVDPTIYQAASGGWVALLSATGYNIAVLEAGFLGGAGYAGLAADFDGDAYADPAVAKTSSGHWKIRLSSAGYSLLDLPDFLGAE